MQYKQTSITCAKQPIAFSNALYFYISKQESLAAAQGGHVAPSFTAVGSSLQRADFVSSTVLVCMFWSLRSFIYSPSLYCARPHPHSPPRPLRRLQQRYLRSSLLSPRSALSFLPPSPSSCGSVGVAARGQRRHPRRSGAGLSRPSAPPCGTGAPSGVGGAPCRGVACPAPRGSSATAPQRSSAPAPEDTGEGGLPTLLSSLSLAGARVQRRSVLVDLLC